MGRIFGVLDDKVHHQLIGFQIEKLGADSGLGVLAEARRIKTLQQLSGLRNKEATLIFTHFFKGQAPEIESVQQKELGFTRQNFTELREIKAVGEVVVFAPKGWNGGRPDLDVAVDGLGEMHAQKWVAKVRDRIHMALKKVIVPVPQIDPFERDHGKISPGVEMPGDFVGVKAGSAKKVSIMDFSLSGESAVVFSSHELALE